MKTKKFTLPILVLVAAILLIAVYSVVSGIAMKPTVTEGEFPFSITYELNGETVTIQDVFKARYVRNDGYADTKTRIYEGEISSMDDGNIVYKLQDNAKGQIELDTQLYADYLMGDTEADYFDCEEFMPRIYYYDAQGEFYDDEDTLKAQGVKLIDYEYPSPLTNSLVYSHISYASGEVVLPTLLIAALALVLILIFVKKENDLPRNTVNVVSVMLNFGICFIPLPYVTLTGMLIDINGGGPEFYHQMMYYIPAFMVLCVAVSVALRRRGYGKSSLVAQLIGPGVFAVYLIVLAVLGLL